MDKRVLDQDSYATRPAGLRWQPWVTVRVYPGILAGGTGLLALGTGAVVATRHWASVLAVGAGIVVGLRSLRFWKELFHFGDVNAAMVVGLDPIRIATCVNLALSEHEEHLAIRVREEPRAALPEGLRRIGVHLPAVCSYYSAPPGSDLNRWADVFSVPATVGTRSETDLARLHDGIPLQDWPELRLMVRGRRTANHARSLPR